MAALTITVFDAETGTTSEYSFNNSPVRIGRNPLNDLSLPFAFVSGWHAVIRFDSESARFFDLGSTNGTLLDGRRVQAGEPVDIGAVLSVTIGKLELRMSAGVGTATRTPAPADLRQDSAWSTPPAVAPTAAWNIVVGDPGRLVPQASAAPSRPVPASAPPPAGTAHVPMHEIHEAVAGLRSSVEAYRRSWSGLFAAIHQTLSRMDAGTRQFALSVVQREFPEVVHEPDFQTMLAEAGVTSSMAPRVAAVTGPDPSAQVAKLARAVRPGEEPPRGGDETAKFLQCVEDVLRASAKAFVELQNGQEQFGTEMGVRTIKEFTPLHAAGTAENVLKYLLDWHSGGPRRTQELVGVYADLMIHQVALINGVLEGARGLLARLDPGEIERSVTAAWPTRGAALWKQYAQRHRELLESDRLLTEAIFGPEFARAYAEVGGEGAARR